MEPLSETARHATGVMERQISQLVRLIDDLMDVSRITRGQLTLRKERIDLRSIIESAVETAQPQLTTAGVALSLEIPDDAAAPRCGRDAHLAGRAQPVDQRREVHALRRPGVGGRQSRRTIASP